MQHRRQLGLFRVLAKLLKGGSSRTRVAAPLFLAFVVSAASCAAVLQRAQKPAPQQQASPATSPLPSPTPDYSIERPTSNPYRGELSIFEDPKRDEKLQPERIMDVLGVREGSEVADIGAGSGWFSVRAARRVGNDGVVYAVEINQRYIDYINKRANKEGFPNIRTILGEKNDALLPEKSIDAALLLKVYHELSEPVRYLANLRKYLRDDARVGIIDRTGSGGDHGIDRNAVVKEVERAGFVLVEEHDFVKPDQVDYFLVFKVKE